MNMEDNNMNVNFVVIWLDKDIDKTKQNQDTKALIRHAVRNQLQTFVDPDECVNYMLEHSNKRIFFIVSGSFGHYLTSLIYCLPQIHMIYVFCVNRSRAEGWAKTELKISGIFTDKKRLVEKLRDDIQSCDQNSQIPISIFHLSDRENSLTNLTEESITFMWYQSLLIVLQRLARLPNSKTDMITECQSIYHDDPIEKEKINKFDKEYRPTKAIWWYTCDCFVYRLLNKALRTQNIDIIFRFRFFLNDLNNQIKQLYFNYLQVHQPIEKHRLQVYRGQHLSLDELNSIKANIHGVISMNTFLSATLNKDLALVFADTGEVFSETAPMQPVLFIIDICDMSKETTPFAPIKSFSCYEEEDEVLFTLGAIFQVQSVELQDEKWHIYLQLSKEQNQLCQDLSKHMLKQIGSDASPLTLGWFLYRMNEFGKAERYTESLLRQLSENDAERGNTYNLLGLICKATGRFQQATDYYEKALENYNRTSHPNSPKVIACHNNFALACLALKDHRRASEHQMKVDQTLMNSSQTNNPLLIAMNESLKAKIENAVGNYAEAIENLENALKTKRKNLLVLHPSIASTLQDLGIVHANMGNDQRALDYFQEALKINQQCLSPYHLDLADLYGNIGRVHYKRGEYLLALQNFEKALDIIKNASREDIDTVEALEKCIVETKKMM